MNKLYLILIPFMLSACGSGEYGDLRDWMKKQEISLKGKIEKLPPVKTFQPIPYAALTDPFSRDGKITPLDMFKNKYAPDLRREKEDLEYLELSTLRMVGSINKNNIQYAIIRDSEKNIYYVKKGNYMGLNYGKIINLNEGEIVLEERIKELDRWEIKETKIYLFEGKGK